MAKIRRPLRPRSEASKNNYKDSDTDGLPDQLEKKLGTNPKKADSDRDGVGDYEEIKIYGTDPLNPDTDNDGMSDGEEIKSGRNPKGPGLLKDLFIPYAGNNYKPQALQPKRLLFHAASAVIIKIILIGAIVILPVEAWLTPDILLEQSKKIISLTNAIRKNLHLGLLSESGLLDQASFNKAQDMLLNQYFAHTGPDNKTLADWLAGVKYNYAVAGENLAMGFTGPEEVINGWNRSQTHYRNMIDPDFTQIGVGVSSGSYNQIDTTLVAQYFAAPAAAKLALVEPETTAVKPAVKEPVKTITQPDQQILGQTVKAPVKPAAAAPIADTTPPQVDLDKSKLYIDQPQGKTEKIVRAEVYLSADTAKARVNFNNYFIDLKPGTDQTAPWTGQTIVFNQGQEQIFNPVILPVITAEDQAGNRMTADLKWENISPAQTTRLKQYFFIKQHQPAYVNLLFDITSIYYKIILIIACIALALNILIQIKKQHPHIILSTLGLIGLLVALIII